MGYLDEEAPFEYMAEGIRAYLTDPNYLKTVAPDTAKRIRQFVNDHPQLRHIIQFNAVPSALGAGMIADELSQDRGERWWQWPAQILCLRSSGALAARQ